MYTVYHEYAWMTEKDHLEFEIGKAEGQLRNCRNRMDLAKREVIICIITFIVASLALVIWKIFRSGKDNPAYLESSYAIVSWLFYLVSIFILSFLGYSMVKSIVFYKLSKRKSGKKESLKEYTGDNKDTLRPERSYVIEEEKLICVLSDYYNHRIYLNELKRKLEDGEFVMTVEELQKELDGLVYFQEIVPASPFSGELVREAKIWGVTISSMLFVLLVMLLLILK